MTTPVISLPLRVLMRFSDPLIEQRFLQFYEGFYRRYAQVSLLLGMLLLLGDWSVDRLVYPAASANDWRLLISQPLLLLGLLCSRSAWGKRHWQVLMSVVLLLVGVSLYGVLWRIDAQGGSGLGSWVGILNFTFFEFYCFFILGISFRYALPTGLALLLGFEAAVVGVLAPQVVRGSYLSYHVFTVFLLAASIGWWREYLLRKEFVALLGQEIATQVAQSQAEFLRGHDAVTELYNLPGFLAVLERERQVADAQGHSLALLLIDLARLRRARAAFGQHAADQWLRVVADHLRCVSQDVQPAPVLARTSSFELAVLLRDVPGVDAVVEVSERLLQGLRTPLHLEGHDLHLQPCGGLGIYPHDGASGEAVLKAARVALTLHVQDERSLHFYDALHDQALARQWQLEEDLRAAWAAGQLHLVYQPVMRAAGGSMVGAEALLRWSHPELGQIPPTQFIPMLEDMGLIRDVGEWVLAQACQQMVAWQQQGVVLQEIAVNVSGAQLADADFAQRVARLLAQSSLLPRHLVLELTESVLVHDNDDALAQLNALKQLGLRLALDDFGTGFSSMSTVARFPFDIIKLDRSFVQAAPTTRSAAAIVEAIMALARRLDMDTVAEGIETAAQLGYIVDLGCRSAQGYLLSPPCAAAELALLWKTELAARTV